jgi:hypothetical protein
MTKCVIIKKTDIKVTKINTKRNLVSQAALRNIVLKTKKQSGHHGALLTSDDEIPISPSLRDAKKSQKNYMKNDTCITYVR